MKASQSAMRTGWGQSAHGTNFKFGFWRNLYAVLTGKRVLICGNGNVVENPPIRFKYEGKPMTDFHGFWSDKAGGKLWNTAVTEKYVCDHPKCIAYAERANKRHDEYFKNPENRKAVLDVIQQTGQIGGLEYNLNF